MLFYLAKLQPLTGTGLPVLWKVVANNWRAATVDAWFRSVVAGNGSARFVDFRNGIPSGVALFAGKSHKAVSEVASFPSLIPVVSDQPHPAFYQMTREPLVGVLCQPVIPLYLAPYAVLHVLFRRGANDGRRAGREAVVIQQVKHCGAATL